MTTIGEIRLHKVGETADMLLFESILASGERGSYQMRLPRYAIPSNAQYIDVRVQVESAAGWHPVGSNESGEVL